MGQLGKLTSQEARTNVFLSAFVVTPGSGINVKPDPFGLPLWIAPDLPPLHAEQVATLRSPTFPELDEMQINTGFE